MTDAPNPAPFAERLSRAPLPHDAERAEEAWARLGPDLPGPEFRELIEGAAGSSPYLDDLMRKEADWIAPALAGAPEAALAEVMETARAAREAERNERGSLLRRGKRRLALLTGLADLGGVWGLEEVTGALSDYADLAVDSALRALVADEAARGRLPGAEDDPEGCAGLVALAMGKGGARELNYSSDIDLIFLFDETRYDPDDYGEVRSRLVKVCQAATQLLSKATGEGYVFRVDLRLRPDPSVTPVCIAMEAAESYYESVGRTWERAAFIKARAAAGDIAAGEAFLERLSPFVWRRYLDFAAIRDAHDIRERIRAHRGTGGEISAPGHDVKLGRGGIREIEFFVQTRQLICGGRDPELRLRGTRPALAALAEAGWARPEDAEMLDAAYLAHRELEHRLQMVEDRQTHSMPTGDSARERVARLSGRDDRAGFEAELVERLTQVAAVTETFFTPEKREAEAEAPDLAARGFARPETGEEMLERWRRGAIPATRSERAREILGRLEPRLLDALASAASPDDALAQFDRFLSGLPAGVQILSLFEANPKLLDLIAEICAAAPRLAEELGRSSRVIDAILATDFFEPLPEADELLADLKDWLEREDDYERKLDAARRWAKEMRFRVGVQLLRGIAEAAEAGAAFTAVAEAALNGLLPEVEAEFARRHGPPPGRGAAVLAMGRMGSREMTATSDLDLIILYDAEGAEQSEGRKPLAVGAYYSRFTQALISAMTAKTAEGALYEIDMRLRPSGRQGTVATSLAGFRSYQAEKAWTWEHLALTRARAVAGREDLRADADAAVAEALALPREAGDVWAAAAEMRGRLAEAGRAQRGNPWAFKRAHGGLMDIELVVQTARLVAESGDGLGLGPAGAEATLRRLAERGDLPGEEAETLAKAHALQSRLQHAARVAVEGTFDPERAGPGLQAVLCRVAGAEDLEALEARLREAQAAAGAIADRRLAEPDAG
ncbi:MAG: bifunctional [glutamine synthetase] adenylyltransferase/[glutamine synthetase]-adenylyl-L-tyrosine phosphorylase [Pseudomonadota bacterium]